MENNELDNLCDRIIKNEIKPLGLTCRYKIENYLDGHSLENLSLKSPGFNEEVKKEVLRKLGFKKEYLNYTYSKRYLSDNERDLARRVAYETNKFNKRMRRKKDLGMEQFFNDFIKDSNSVFSQTFGEYQKGFKNLKNEVEK